MEDFADREYLIDLQNASGIAHKSDADPDVKNFKDSVSALKKEVVERLKDRIGANVLEELLLNSGQLAQCSAWKAGTLGILDPGKTETEIKQIKTILNVQRSRVEDGLV